MSKQCMVFRQVGPVYSDTEVGSCVATIIEVGCCNKLVAFICYNNCFFEMRNAKSKS